MRERLPPNDRSRLRSTTVEALRLATLPIEYGTRMSIGDESDPRAYMQLAAVLRKAIMAGKYPAGTATPSITTLSQDYGHARQTCSKALGVLVKEGLLIRYPGLGYYVVGKPGDPRPANPESAAGKPDAPQPAAGAPVSVATPSTWWVIGNASNARRFSSVQPPPVSRARSRARVAGSQET